MKKRPPAKTKGVTPAVNAILPEVIVLAKLKHKSMYKNKSFFAIKHYPLSNLLT